MSLGVGTADGGRNDEDDTRGAGPGEPAAAPAPIPPWPGPPPPPAPGSWPPGVAAWQGGPGMPGWGSTTDTITNPWVAPPRRRHPQEPPTPDRVRRSIALLVSAVAVGLVVDVGLRGGVIGLGSALALTAVAVGLVILAPDRPAERWGFAGLAVVAAGGLVWRTSPWIVVLDWGAAIAFVGLAASTNADRPILGSSLVRLVWRGAGPAAVGPWFGPGELVASVDVMRRRPRTHDLPATAWRRAAPAVARGLVITAPIVVVVGLLLASADGVFASFFDLPTPTVGNPLLHLFLIGAGATVLSGLVRWTREPIDLTGDSNRPLGPVETIIVLGALTLLYALFAVAQVVASTGGDARIRETTGLTYAEYARTGFFQLLWAAAITMAVLLGVRALTRPGGHGSSVAIRMVSATTCALTLVVVAAAITRLGLYQDAYGLTMLRLACTTFAWILGAAFVLLGIRMLQPRGRDWLPTAYLGLAVAALVWWNGSNPEVTVAETNLTRATATGKLDVDYLVTMSDDAMPALIDGIDALPTAQAEELRSRLCTPTPDRWNAPGGSHVTVDRDGIVRVRSGWAAFNTSRRAAVEAVQGCADGEANH